MGIEVLNPNSAAVGIYKEGIPLQPALMLPSQQKQPACLITPPTTWAKGDKITINMQGKEVSAIFTNSVQNTGLFSQYQFEISSEDAPQENEQNLTNNKLADSDIWSLI